MVEVWISLIIGSCPEWNTFPVRMLARLTIPSLSFFLFFLVTVMKRNATGRTEQQGCRYRPTVFLYMMFFPPSNINKEGSRLVMKPTKNHNQLHTKQRTMQNVNKMPRKCTKQWHRIQQHMASASSISKAQVYKITSYTVLCNKCSPPTTCPHLQV